MDIQTILRPETELEGRIISDDRFRVGCGYGKPRPGHPEGKVVFHIREVLENIDKYSLPNNRTDLRLVGLIHDTFKYKVDRKIPKTGENHHGMIARRFAEEFFNISRVLETIELHDEAYNSWKKGNRKSNWEGAEERAKRSVQRLSTDIDFYLTFYRCDSETGDKSQESYNWFENLVETESIKTQ